jgi:Ran GTPase-activating protein (RanGAP) involved in mRNA processing and transport
MISLQRERMASTKKLFLKGERLQVGLLNKKVSQYNNLEDLILENCDLGNDWAKSLADKLDSYKSLVRLDIKNNQISAKGLTYLCSAMSNPECKIKFLDIRHNILMDN